MNLGSFYGDNNRFFIGVVVNNDDSDFKLGRCQVRIFGVHDNWQDIPNSDLPWASVVLPTTEGGINGIGSNPMLEIGSQVFGFFLDGKDSQMPIILGSIPKIMIPTEVQTSENSTADIANNTLTGSTNAEKAFNFFVDRGFEPTTAAAFVGNFVSVSGTSMDPTTKDGDRFGICAWKGTRRASLVEHAREIDIPETKLATQLSFVLKELTFFFPETLAGLKKSKTIEERARKIRQTYLKDSQSDPIKSTNSFVKVAEDVYERFN